METPSPSPDEPNDATPGAQSASSIRDWLQNRSWLVLVAYVVGIAARRFYDVSWGISLAQQSSLLSLEPVIFGALCLALVTSAAWSGLWLSIVILAYRPTRRESLSFIEAVEALTKAFAPSFVVIGLGPFFLANNSRDGLYVIALPYLASVGLLTILFILGLTTTGFTGPTRITHSSDAIVRKIAGVSEDLKTRFDLAKIAVLPSFLAAMMIYPVVSASWGGGAETPGLIEIEESSNGDSVPAASWASYPALASRMTPSWNELPLIRCSDRSLYYIGSIVERNSDVTIIASIPSQDGAWNYPLRRSFVVLPNSRIRRIVVPDLAVSPSAIRRATQAVGSCGASATLSR